MWNVILVSLIALSAVWVYLDATSTGIGKVPGAKSLFNISAGAWATLTLLFWIVGFPAYLMKRRALIERAKQTPVEISGRVGKTAVLAFAGALWVASGLAELATTELPGCDSDETKRVIAEIVSSELGGARLLSLEQPSERAYNESEEVRACHAVIVTTGGKEFIQYIVRWNNKLFNEFVVQIL